MKKILSFYNQYRKKILFPSISDVEWRYDSLKDQCAMINERLKNLDGLNNRFEIAYEKLVEIVDKVNKLDLHKDSVLLHDSPKDQRAVINEMRNNMNGLNNRFDTAYEKLNEIEDKVNKLNLQKDGLLLPKYFKAVVLDQNPANSYLALKVLEQSKSQLGQDMFVLANFDFMKSGFFVEFGATNGVDLSNTYILEKLFSWKGIVAEPSKRWHEDLFRFRGCDIETACVWSETAKILEFNDVRQGEYSTIDEYSDCDFHSGIRKINTKYQVETISLRDLLLKYNAPKEIQYLSIDTEGSEFQILKNFDFDEYKIKIITVEHNFTPMRDELYMLLTKNGYVRVYEEFSRWDDWYIHI